MKSNIYNVVVFVHKEYPNSFHRQPRRDIALNPIKIGQKLAENWGNWGVMISLKLSIKDMTVGAGFIGPTTVRAT